MFPLLKGQGAYQYRNFSPDAKLKYKTYGPAMAPVIRRRGDGEVPLVLVEDFRSAFKVSQVAPSVPILSTKVSDEMVARLIQFLNANRGITSLVIWLDNDNRRVISDSIAMQDTLKSCLKVPVYRVKSSQCKRDPKELHLHSIEALIDEVRLTS